MAEIVGGLFGVSPEQLVRQRQATDTANAFRFAQLAPLEQAKMSIYQGSAGLGRGISGLLGGDPELERVSQIKQLSSQFDLTTAQGARDFARALQPFAPQEAMMAVREADRIEQSGLGRQKTVAETTLAEARTQAALREKTAPTSPLGKLIAERDLLPPNDPRRAAYDRAIAAEGEGRGTKIIMPGDAQGKILREKRTGKLLDLEDRALEATDTLQLVSDFRNIVGTAFTGAGAKAKLTAAQFANALGVSVTGTSESEQLNQMFAALTTGQAKNLKGSLSDKDLAFLKEAVGTSGLTEETLRNVIGRIERNALIEAKTFDLASQYKGDYADLNIVELRKRAQKEVNERADKQKRLDELRRKQNQPI
jgi:hypothetical protein